MEKLTKKREQIDLIDDQIMHLLDERFTITQEIKQIKDDSKLSTTDHDREIDILSKTYDYSKQKAIYECYKNIISISKDFQNNQSYLLGGDTSYSLSPIIHEYFHNKCYECLSLEQLNPLDIDHFPYFKALNITNPYKRDYYQLALNKNFIIDNIANQTKVCNLIVKEDNNYCVFNTDYQGFINMLKFYQLDFYNKNILILGNGATSTTVLAALSSLGYNNNTVAARNPHNAQEITFDQVLDKYEVIINTTSYGVSPNLEITPLVNISQLHKLETIIDINYNPLRSILGIINKEVKYYNGLYMLIDQARLAEEIIQKQIIDQDFSEKILLNLTKQQQNIVLIGMPLSGKTTIGKNLSAFLNKTFYDSDIILKEENISLKKMLENGFSLEDYRNYENEVIKTLSNLNDAVISTGGGIIENIDNINYLKQQGIIVFLDASLDVLINRYQTLNTKNRPLIKNKEDLINLYQKRYQQYVNSADVIIKIDNEMNDVNTIISTIINLIK